MDMPVQVHGLHHTEYTTIFADTVSANMASVLAVLGLRDYRLKLIKILIIE